MGLDMYLYAEKYVSNYSFNNSDEKAVYTTVVDAAGLGNLAESESPHFYVKIAAGYWRKANAIHGWFVDNVCDGGDDCGYHYVPREQLYELRDACREVLANPENAADMLPPRDGFFFGSNEIDQWYVDGLKRTIEIIDKIEKFGDDVAFYYHASW